MSIQHKELAQGRWKTLSFIEQMANIGSELERALAWKEKGNQHYSQLAFERGLELLDLSLDDTRNYCGGRLKELTRVREALVDYFLFSNEYGSSALLWHNYFMAFGIAARKNR